jgi:hypothetical protein
MIRSISAFTVAFLTAWPAVAGLQQMQCDTVVTEMDTIAKVAKETADYPDKATALKVLEKLKEYPGMNKETIAAGRTLRNDPPAEDVDLKKLFTFSDCSPIGFFRHWKKLIHTTQSRNFTAEERKQVRDAIVAYLKTDLDDSFTMISLGIRMAVLGEANDAGLFSLDAKQKTSLARLKKTFEKNREAARARFAQWESEEGVDTEALQKLPAPERKQLYLAIQTETRDVHAMAEELKGLLAVSHNRR